MQTTIYYFLQVVFCSAIMMGYYWLVLRNKQFHQYNRFYLLLVAGLAWLVPLIKIQLNGTNISEDTNIYYLLSAVADNNTVIESSFKFNWYNINWQNGLKLLYAGGVLFLLSGFFISLFRIYQLFKLNKVRTLGDIDLVITNAKGTPYSFFRYIFWNEAIDLSSATGQQILQHEVTHVKEKHSFDKIYMQLNLIAGWFNPFFWLIKKELHMIHEFIADKKSVDNGDTASLAQMLLAAAYPQHQFNLTNPFFFSPIKRRIAMLNQHQNPRFSYLRRLVVLPLLAITIVLVAFRNTETTQPISVETVMDNIYQDISGKPVASVAPLNMTFKNTYTIVINAGHGGADKGGVGVDGKSTEAALTLELANTIKSLNQNSQLNLVFTRSADESQSVAEIAAIANKANPDLFVSLHYNSSKNNQLSGTEIYIANPAKTNSYNSHLQFANQLANDLDDLKMPFKGIKSKQEGVYVLQNINCPSVLVEAGYLSNSTDLEKIKSPQFRDQLAVALLNGIQKYILAKESGKLISPEPLYLINGKIVDKSDFNNIDPRSIQSIEVLKANKALETFGQDGKNGVIKVTMKSSNDRMLEGVQIFSAVQEEPKFDGGKEAWSKFLQEKLNRSLPIEKGAVPGNYTVVLSFIVDTKGKVSNVEAENDPGYGTAEEAVRVMKLSPNWIPAKQNGKPVLYKNKQTITYSISEEK
ncbi:MAG: N-acetylmuramoyl-L-alanine amidase [Sediminibacterium sp.]|uniref:N-acetylmuramoyl-L-alanine amidase n=1 Tax=Sediminibacterium sp. TaxID=1917865 RepID=UPI002724CAAE|nr:N-acetylmuramoyl-L-alanine amidase [Sediminibacterium sp.]MDO8995978.1 N-acetylmuramoyl-L-alanine amidase [Sediminibacterium sp.]